MPLFSFDRKISTHFTAPTILGLCDLHLYRTTCQSQKRQKITFSNYVTFCQNYFLDLNSKPNASARVRQIEAPYAAGRNIFSKLRKAKKLKAFQMSNISSSQFARGVICPRIAFNSLCIGAYNQKKKYLRPTRQKHRFSCHVTV
jgi:hypothetical protein